MPPKGIKLKSGGHIDLLTMPDWAREWVYVAVLGWSVVPERADRETVTAYAGGKKRGR